MTWSLAAAKRDRQRKRQSVSAMYLDCDVAVRWSYNSSQWWLVGSQLLTRRVMVVENSWNKVQTLLQRSIFSFTVITDIHSKSYAR